MLTAFSPTLATEPMSILPKHRSSHQASLTADTGLPLQVIVYKSGRSITTNNDSGTR